MARQNEIFEMIKDIIANEQLGCPKNLKLVVVEESLSDKDKYKIKQAVLNSAAKNTTDLPYELANNLIEAIKLINKS